MFIRRQNEFIIKTMCLYIIYEKMYSYMNGSHITHHISRIHLYLFCIEMPLKFTDIYLIPMNSDNESFANAIHLLFCFLRWMFFFASLKIILMAKPFQRDDIYTNIFIGMWINTNRHTYFTISHVPPHIWCLNHFYLVWSGSYHILMCVECC